MVENLFTGSFTENKLFLFVNSPSEAQNATCKLTSRGVAIMVLGSPLKPQEYTPFKNTPEGYVKTLI